MLRNYTVSGFRPGTASALAELDVDFVLHGDEGFASNWAVTAQPGDRVAILDEGLIFVPPADARRILIVSDETGLPAIARLTSLDFDTHGLYAFAIGESQLATGARRHLVSERGLPKSHVAFCGFWRHEAH